MPLPTSSRLQTRRNFFKRLRIYAYTSGVFLVLIGLYYFLVSSSFFKISAIQVRSTEPIDEVRLLTTLKTQVASGRLAGWLGVDSYLAWPTTLKYTAPNVSKITIEKAFWSKEILITVVPRERYAVWCNSETSCGWVDSQGIMFQTAPITEGQLLRTIFENGTSSPGIIGDFVLASSSFMVVRKTIDEMKKMSIGVSKISVDRELQELYLDTNEGARIMLSLRFDPSSTTLPAIKRFSDQPGFSKIEYLNLTVENRAYLKYR